MSSALTEREDKGHFKGKGRKKNADQGKGKGIWIKTEKRIKVKENRGITERQV